MLLIALGITASIPGMAQDPVQPDTSIVQEARENVLDNIPVISLDENDMQDGSAQNVSSLLSAGRDPFFTAASFNFNVVRFRIRGYDSDLFETFMNGIPLENLDNGFTPYGQWGGLNDVLRNREATLGLRAVTFSHGNIGGATFIDSRASRQRKQTSFNYALSNRNYSHRWMLTHSTGLNKKGWAFTVSGSRRWAEEGYTDGTYYDGWSGFVGVDKRFNTRHLLSLVAFAASTENGRQGASVKEMINITGDNFYNPYWGMQAGKKRNSSIGRSLQPTAILTHEWKINDRTSLMTAGSFSKGYRSTTALDWYNAPDPRPDYYRYLPSYQLDPEMYNQVLTAMRSDVNLRQINWDRLYNVNYGNVETIENVNGIEGNDVTGKRSLYIVEERKIGTTRYNLNSILNVAVASNVDLTAGVTYQNQRNNYYKEVDDLLGGEFYVDINQFAERDFPDNETANQNDLNNPNRLVKQGDKFGYNYDINIQRASAWIQSVFRFRKIDFFLSAEHSYTQFYRYGNVKNGLFPEDSYGKGDVHNFYNYSAKGGITFKIDGRNYIFANGGYLTKAPYFENAYLAPRTRDFVQENMTSEKIATAELGYVMNAPGMKIRATGFYTNFRDQMNVISFYNDEFRNFVNYAISNIGKEHMGVEFGLNKKIYKGLSLNAAASVGRYRYNTRQDATVTLDNSNSIVSQNTVYSKNFNVPTPQEAYSIGLDYRSPKFWFVNVNFNFFNEMWLDFNPLRRTYSAVEGLDPKSEAWHRITDQTQLDEQYTLDAFAGYSWLMNRSVKGLRKPTYLVFNVGVNNILNNKDIVSGGFEQMRFDFQQRNPDKFPPRLFYAYGINYFASIGIRF